MFAEALKRLPPAPQPVAVNEYRERQMRLAQQFRSDDVFILAAPAEAVHSNDVHYRYRTSSDVLYLTGWHDPEATYVLRHDGRSWKSILFVQPKDTLMEIWEGRRLGCEGALEHHPVDEAYPTHERDQMLIDWLAGAKRVFHRSGVHADLDRLILERAHA